MSDNEGMSKGEIIEKQVGEAIAKAITENGEGLTIKWVALVEVYDPEGERKLWTFVNDDSMRWDVFGILKELEHMQTAHAVAEILQERGL